MIPTHAGALMPHPAGGGVAPVIGWLDSVVNPDGVAAHANTGVGQYKLGFELTIINESMYAGIVGYTGGVVAWQSQWAPTEAEAAPNITPMSGGRVEIQWPDLGGFPPRAANGLLTLTATIDGGPPSASIEVTSATSFYTDFAWGPTP